ncbi:molybdenum cofactor guanylyltransferase [Thiomicrorhabdus immobilis]|uniref:Molybdenum cofactor guanylyltransferase n=1 Tax=Thiomicrorhabdus immobilis TaxID=2791037 RepID=A0ABM7MB10_9GAMM|nr:molybdenum cofactor guanylyltransferase MobA [Thiomicrorhabdus immobilis]BCN92478.1 molybdenum cofactor guanylyltransferase [Thiomicrorhabdus immobilis]
MTAKVFSENLSPTFSDISGVVIAGGRGSRVGYQQKALLTYKGEPILKPIMHSLTEQTVSVWVNANAELERYHGLTRQLFSDEYQGFLGPLAGMHAAWQYIETDWAVFVPCDNPNLPHDFVNRLLEAYQSQNNPLVVVDDGERIQPLYLLMHRSMQDSLSEAIAKNHLSVNRWVKENAHTTANFADCCPEAFQNMNTLASFAEAEIS